MMHKYFCLPIALLLIAGAVLYPNCVLGQNSQVDVYFANQIWPGDGPAILDGAMVVRDGKIVNVGPRADIPVPDAAQEHHLGNHVIIPGLIASQTTLSGIQPEERTITPEIRATDGYDFFADRSELLKSGITTVQLSPGENRLMPGTSGVVRLAGESISEKILNEQESLRIILSSASRNPPTIFEPAVGPVSEDRPLTQTRPQFGTLTASLAGLRSILRQATSEQTSTTATEADETIETVRELIAEKVPLRITAVSTPEIRGAVSLAKEFNLPIVLVDCKGLKPFAQSFGTWKPFVKGIILSGATPGQISNPTQQQIAEMVAPWEFASELIEAGIPVAIRTRNDNDLTQLMFVAGQFLKDGLTREQLLGSLTSGPAKLMGIASKVGTLKKGKLADFVVLSGSPFKLHTRVVSTYTKGNSTFKSVVTPTTKVVEAGQVYSNGEFHDGASIVVKGSTVRSVGSSVSAPGNAEVKSFGPDSVVVPGFVDMGAGLGLGGPLTGNVTLQTKLGEQLYEEDPAIAYARKNGITTALLSPKPSTASPVVAFKLGEDVRVISDPVAIQFKLTGNTASGIAANEKLLKAGKAYADSWIKYEKDLAEYEAKSKEAKSKAPPKKPEAKKEEPKKEESKDAKKEPEKKEADKKEVKEKPVVKDKKEPPKEEKKDKPEDKKEEKKEKPLPDPITGTWEGEIDSERIPPQLKEVKFELELSGSEITGSVEFFRQSIEIANGSFDRSSKEMTIVIERRGRELEISGALDAEGTFKGSFGMGPQTVELTAKRTVDKSKKPEEEPEEKETPKPEDGEKPKPKEGEKPKEGDKPKPKEGDKPEDKEKPKDEEKKESDKKEAEKKEGSDKDESKKTEEKKVEELKPPKKPRESASLEPYRALFAGKIPAIVESRDLNSIKATAELFVKKYKVRTIIIGADDLARKPDLLADFDVSVLAGPSFSVKIDREPPTNMPQLFANEQLPFGFRSEGTTGSGQLHSAVQFVVSQGLSTTDALNALTMMPAKMLSEDTNFGEIAAGKDADLVVLSGPPFEYSTEILAVMIDGQWVYEKEEQE